MNGNESWKFIDCVVDKSIPQGNCFVYLDCLFLCRISLFSFDENVELLFLLGIDTLFEQLSAQVRIRQYIYHIFGIWLRLRDESTANLLLLKLSPIENLYDPIERLCLDEVEGDILSMPFYNCRCIVDGDIVQFLCVYSHNFESFGLLAQTFNSCKGSLHLISIGEHLLDEDIIFLNILLLDIFGLQVGKGIANSCAVAALLMPIQTCNSAAFDLTPRTCILIQCTFAHIAQLLSLCELRHNKFRRLLFLADFLTFLELLPL